MKYYLISFPNDFIPEWPIVISRLGSYIATRDDAFATDAGHLAHLSNIAKQKHNLRVGYTSYIINSFGNPVWRMRVELVEEAM